MKNIDVELHDAILNKCEIDYCNKIICISISMYSDENSKNRVEAIIKFINVSSFSQISDFNDLADNKFAGNIAYWHPKIKGTTFIYLASGVISITAKNIELQIYA